MISLLSRCTNAVGASVVFEVVIESPCRVGQMACQDGTCLPVSRFCDGQYDCHDKSDERRDVCPGTKASAITNAARAHALSNNFPFRCFPARRPSVIANPESITADPWQLIRFSCISPGGHPLTARFSATGRPVKDSPRYRVHQVNTTTMEIVAPRGLRGPEDSTQIE